MQAQTERGKIYIKQGKYDLAEEDFKNDAAKRNEIQVIFIFGIVFSSFNLDFKRSRSSVPCSHVQRKLV